MTISNSAIETDRERQEREAQSSMRRLSRWYWPAVGLVGWILFEMTAEPVYTMLLLCFRFSWQEIVIGFWIRKNDQNHARGKACFWMYLTRGAMRMIFSSLGLTLGLALIDFLLEQGNPQIAPQGNQQVPHSTVGLLTASGVGLMLILLFGFVGCVKAKRSKLRIWLDPAFHECQMNGTWPPTGFGTYNSLRIAFYIIVSMLVLFIFISGIYATSVVAGWVPKHIPVLNDALVAIPFGLVWMIGGNWLVYKITRRVCADNWWECWYERPESTPQGQ